MGKRALLLVMCLPALFALMQTRNVNGKVVDESGNPVGFATIRAQGGAGGVAADASGNFRIPLADTVTAITVSATGYKTLTVSVQGLETVTVTMARESGQLHKGGTLDPSGVPATSRSLALKTRSYPCFGNSIFSYLCCPLTAG